MKTIFKMIPFAVFGLLLLASCGAEDEPTEEETAVAQLPTPTTDVCKDIDAWFPHSSTPAPNEGATSVFANSSTTNAIFHRWSWQKFLWLTKPTSTSDTTPVFLNQDSIRQVTASLGTITQASGTVVQLEYNNQAGSNGILKTNPAYNPSNNTAETVLYSLHVSPTMYNSALKFKDSLMNGSLDSNNMSAFPVGSLELKISWVDTAAIPVAKRGDYFTTTASVQTISGTDTTYVPKRMAMLGMHVVGVVENHPEFIWATFEHDDMAPNYDWTTNTASSPNDLLLFKEGSTTGIDGITWDSTTQNVKAPSQAFDLFQYGVPFDANGPMLTAQSELENFNNIKDINTCVRAKLNTANDVFGNYFYNGSIWINTDGLSTDQQAQLLVGLRSAMANAEPQSFARGSLNCANVTMETFTQTFQSNIDDIKVINVANCFSCHHAVSFSSSATSSPLYMSHLFDAYLLSNNGNSEAQIEALKNKRARLRFLVDNVK